MATGWQYRQASNVDKPVILTTMGLEETELRRYDYRPVVNREQRARNGQWRLASNEPQAANSEQQAISGE
jgi:DNA polymerase III psi subunit